MLHVIVEFPSFSPLTMKSKHKCQKFPSQFEMVFPKSVLEKCLSDQYPMNAQAKSFAGQCTVPDFCISLILDIFSSSLKCMTFEIMYTSPCSFLQLVFFFS